MNSTKDKTFSGLKWSTIQRFGTMGITFTSNMVLARFLSPEDFGCIGMLMIFISLANTLIDGGFGSALIQKKNPSTEDYSTIFFWNIILSTLLYGVLYLTAPYIALFYKIPLLASVLRIQGLTLIFNSFSIVQQNILRKQLLFKTYAKVSLSATLLSVIIAIFGAVKGWGVWSLVAQQISLSVFCAIFYWLVTNWYPKFIFSFKSFKELFKFGGFMLLSHVFSTLSNEIQGLIVGRMFSPAHLGIYSQAYRLEGAVATSASSVIDQVSFPVLASMQSDNDKLKITLKRFIQITALVCAPLMVLMIIVAEPLIITLYSAKWVDCIPYFQILCVAGLAVCLQGAANNTIAAIGKSAMFFKWTIIKRTITILLCFLGVAFGMYGLLWGCVLGAWCVYVINSLLVSHCIGYSFIKQFLDIVPFIIISCLVGVCVCVFNLLCPITNIYISLIIQILIYLVLYSIVILFLNLESVAYIKELLKRRF